MAIHIKMKDNYYQVTTYFGKLDDKYPFMVETAYNSEIGDHSISSVEFVEDNNLYSSKSKKYWSKSKDKIENFVMKWLFKKPKVEKYV